MSAPYVSVSITGYNDNPPPDDGSESEENRIYWATIKEKLPDPLKTALEAIDTNIIAAFAKVIGGAGVTTSSISATVAAVDQGKLYRATAAGITITTPDATSVGSPFVFGHINSSDGDTTLDGNGSQTVDGDASITLGPREGILVWTDGTNWFTIGRAPSRLIPPQGYLTLTSGTPVISGDVAGATSVYYTPDIGNLIPIPDGTKFAIREFSELTLTLNANHVANAIYDIFAFSDSGTLRLGTGPAWTTATAGSGARGTGAGTTELERLKGLYVNKVSMTARNGASTYSVAAKSGIYLGSMLMDGTNGQVTCHRTWGASRKWGVWNVFNRKPIILKAGEATASWNYTTNTIRQSGGFGNSTIALFAGLAEEIFDLSFTQKVSGGTGSAASAMNVAWEQGIGWNSTTAYSGTVAHSGITGSTSAGGNWCGTLGSTPTAKYIAPPAQGLNNVNSLERTTTATGTGVSINYQGGEDDMVLVAKYMG